MSELTLAFYIISIAANLLLGFFVLLRNTKEKINSTFFTLILSVIGWQVSLLLFYITESPTTILWIGRFNFAIVLIMLFYLLKFSLIFPSESLKISKKFLWAVSLWIMVFFALTLFTPLVDKTEIIIGPVERETIYGILYPLYILHYIVFAGGGIYLISKKLKAIKDKLEKYQLIYFVGGVSSALFLGFLSNILLPLLGIQQTAYFGPLATILFSGVTAYAISKYYLFDIKVLATEFFVGIMGIILLAEVVLSSSYLKVISLFAFLLFLLFGYFLIKSVINEIGYRKKLESAYEELKRLDESKSEFISIASHQLRTPLSAIKGYISLLLENTYGPIEEKTKAPLKNVYQANERLIAMVNHLLNISRIEGNRIKLDFKKTSVEKIIVSVVGTMKIKAKEKNLYLRFEKPKETIPEITIDEEKISQAILNLVDNAIHYTKNGGVVIGLEKGSNSIIIKVKDTGVGLEEEDLNQIKSFSRGKQGSLLWTEGIGLGLYVTKKFVEIHQGKIWFESGGPNKGSTFFIKLPIK
ncbi:ATP-binding protein [Candidatus Parcubacteria bacterium]|nr:hypothetical protein [Patescibacteria group bacterium]MBU4466792.1 hypothetical protein [Patescibacteria group bacterium]MCG2688372.1 ATP-binding protein [Candidatus Parcubacteria bacterium]